MSAKCACYLFGQIQYTHYQHITYIISYYNIIVLMKMVRRKSRQMCSPPRVKVHMLIIATGCTTRVHDQILDHLDSCITGTILANACSNVLSTEESMDQNVSLD
jgi:hypothetical protein